MSEYFFDLPEFNQKSLITLLQTPFENDGEKLLSGKFQIRGEKFGQYNDRVLNLTSKNLHIYDSSNTYLGSINLLRCRNQYDTDETSSNKKYKILFSQNLLSEEFLTKD